MRFDKTSIISLAILAGGLALEATGVRCSCIYLTIIYFYLLITSVRNYSITHSYSLFLLCFGVFLMGRVILDTIGLLEINLTTKWQFYNFSDRTIVLVNTAMALSLIFIQVGLGSKPKIIFSKNSQETINKVFKVSKMLVILLIPFAVAKLYFDFSQIRAGSYTDLYMGLQRSPLVIRAGWYLATLILPLLLADTLNKKNFKIFLTLFVLLNFFDFLQGSRGALLRPGMFILWYYYKVISKKKANDIVVISVFIVFAFVANFILEMRSDEKAGRSGVYDQVMYVAENLGSSYYVNAYYAECHKEINGIDQLYVVGPVIDAFVGFFDRDLRGQSDARIKNSYGLSHKITYYIAPGMYLDGHGYGCSYIAEIYSTVGFISVIIFSFFIGRFIKFIEDNIKHSPVVRIMSWFWIQNLMFMARGSLLGFVINMCFTLILYKIILSSSKTKHNRVIIANG